ncbi:6-methylsalicylic acid decarboxylase [Lachnellula arida]|uniref:6-methylsalicylate decarboxylase n=1 Tax=Lachnellula arida TaxID=1316785 RepID=A0A8T9BJ56_9HELO|nr:6-methylsalicylic acid decarboxylase [Lachnellula arida]
MAIKRDFIQLMPLYDVALQESGGDPSGWTIPHWTLEKDIDFMDAEGITFAFLSMTAPGASILPVPKQGTFCRQANEYAAQMRATHPTRYGFFATIPSLEDPSLAHRELIYALDVLGADGIILYTRYGSDNHYLGHPDFRSTWDLLDARGAVVFVHPTTPVDTTLVNAALPQPMIDYPHETTRTAVDLIVSRTLSAHPNVKVLLSHAGGTLPYLALRPAVMLPHMANASTKSTEEFMEEARSFYFDTALSGSHSTLGLLKNFAKPDHVLFGSDFPYAPAPAIKQMNTLVDEYNKIDSTFVRSINHGAAVKLIPRLAAVVGKRS